MVRWPIIQFIFKTALKHLKGIRTHLFMFCHCDITTEFGNLLGYALQFTYKNPRIHKNHVVLLWLLPGELPLWGIAENKYHTAYPDGAWMLHRPPEQPLAVPRAYTPSPANFHQVVPGVQSIHQDSNVHGANMGPNWVLSAPEGPHVGPMKLAIRVRSR